jgi:hypothetical protein
MPLRFSVQHRLNLPDVFPSLFDGCRICKRIVAKQESFSFT